MTALLGARAALLQALFDGPGAVPELTERLARASAGQLKLRQGPASVALGSLEDEGLVRSWTAPAIGGGRGRPRRYFELTGRGIDAASRQRTSLRGIVGMHGRRVASAHARRLMGERLADAIALSDFANTLRTAPRRRVS